MTTTMFPARAVLENVPRVHFYEGGERCPEDLPFPSVMRAVLEYLGENLGCKHCRPQEKSWGLGCAYSYFCAVSGIAWALNWKSPFDGESFALMQYLSEDLVEPYRRAFEAVGYSFEYLPASAGQEALLEKIRASIYERKRPVIGFGVVGPPEAVIITGYDKDGDVLLGWSFFQNMPELAVGTGVEQPSGYFRKPDWYKDTQGLLLIGEKGPVPPQDRVFLNALQWAVQVLRGGERNGMSTGLAAYEAWAADLERDALFPPGDEAALRQRHEVHGFAVGQVAEGRWYGSQWLINTFEKAHFNLSEPLLKAAACLAGEHELMWKIWDLTGGISNPDAWKFLAEPAIRRQIIPVILASRDKAALAAAYIEEALGKL